MDLNLNLSPGPSSEQASPASPPPTVRARTMDLETARSMLAPYKAKVDQLVQEAQTLEVKDVISRTSAVELAGTAKRTFNTIEKARKEYLAPLAEHTKAVNNLAKILTEGLQRVENTLKTKINHFNRLQEMERRKQQEEERRRAEELQKQVNEEAKAAGVEPIQVEVPVVPEPVAKTRTAAGTYFERKEWKHRVVDEAKVPREYLVVSDAAIRQAVKAGIREIPGVEIFEETISGVRT